MFERTSVDLDVHARIVVCALDAQTGEIIMHRNQSDRAVANDTLATPNESSRGHKKEAVPVNPARGPLPHAMEKTRTTYQLYEPATSMTRVTGEAPLSAVWGCADCSTR